MSDTKIPALRRTAARACVITALAVLPIAALDVAASAEPIDPGTSIAVERPHHRNDGWPRNDGYPRNNNWERDMSDWTGRLPGAPFPGMFPPSWDGPRDYRHGRPFLPPRVCSGSFGSC
ncbi:hypothetical protein AB0L82_42445 [Nocardia sp. NPDC052001]|uniref:hypothetical protein n=1 Tax=Nocardia sp. NPDC052001 TaxID=3154853 RepID=UPI00342F800F